MSLTLKPARLPVTGFGQVETSLPARRLLFWLWALDEKLLELPNLPNLKTTLESPAAAAAHGYTLDRGWAGWSPREKPNITLGLCLPNLGEGGWARLGSSTAISATSVLFTKVRVGIRPTPTFSVCKTTTYHTFMCACGRAGGLGREGCCCLREVRVSGAGGGWVGGRAWGACRGCPEGVWRACGGRGQQGVRCARLCVGWCGWCGSWCGSCDAVRRVVRGRVTRCVGLRAWGVRA